MQIKYFFDDIFLNLWHLSHHNHCAFTWEMREGNFVVVFLGFYCSLSHTAYTQNVYKHRRTFRTRKRTEMHDCITGSPYERVNVLWYSILTERVLVEFPHILHSCAINVVILSLSQNFSLWLSFYHDRESENYFLNFIHMFHLMNFFPIKMPKMFVLWILLRNQKFMFHWNTA